MWGLTFRWKKLAGRKKFWLFCSLGLLLLAGTLILTMFSSRFADRQQGPALSDWILDRLPAVDLDFLVTEGFLLIMISFLLAVLIYQPEEIPFVLLTTALFIFVRAVFVAMTHLGAPADILKLSWQTGFLRNFSFTNDLFFSGHTGLPFLAYLIMKRPGLKIYFLAGSIVMGSAVLLSHIHYSIDVFAAFFITFGVFKIAERFFGGLRA